MRTYISNNCSNLTFYFTEKREYDNPIVGALFVNDLEYVKFCKNLYRYLSTKPVFGKPRIDSKWAVQNKGGWYKHKEIKTPYPVMYLNDVEIHWIHESDEKILLEKFNRRLDRFLKEKPIPIFLLSCSDLCNDHTEEDYTVLVKDFLSIPTSVYLTRTKTDLSINEDATKTGRIDFIDAWVGKGNGRNGSHILNIHTVGDRLEDFKRVVYCSMNLLR